MTNIDWSKPIKAVHEDGRVTAVTLKAPNGYGGTNPDCEGQYWTDGGELNRAIWNADGIGANSHARGWRIRNVADTDTVTDWVQIKRGTLKEWENRFDGRFGDWCAAAFQELGLIKPDPTPADRFKSAHPEWELLDRSELVERALAWKGETA